MPCSTIVRTKLIGVDKCAAYCTERRQDMGHSTRWPEPTQTLLDACLTARERRQILAPGQGQWRVNGGLPTCIVGTRTVGPGAAFYVPPDCPARSLQRLGHEEICAGCRCLGNPSGQRGGTHARYCGSGR